MTNDPDDRSPRRRFERTSGEATEFWEIERDGIRCRIGWGRVGQVGRTMLSVRDDADDARRHLAASVAAKLREGYVEIAAAASVAAPAAAPPAPADDARVVDLLSRGKHHAPRYLPVDGFDGVLCHQFVTPNPEHCRREYLVERDGGRSAVWFTLRESSFDAQAVHRFLAFVVPRRDLPFAGSHHKLALPEPVGRFTHALFRAPRFLPIDATAPMTGRMGSAFPIFDCEIADTDSEVLVDARTSGRDAIPSNRWDREPAPVIDLRFQIEGKRVLREKTFKVHGRRDLDQALAQLVAADPAGPSFLEIRNYRGAVLRLGPGKPADGIDAFLRGEPAAS